MSLLAPRGSHVAPSPVPCNLLCQGFPTHPLSATEAHVLMGESLFLTNEAGGRGDAVPCAGSSVRCARQTASVCVSTPWVPPLSCGSHLSCDKIPQSPIRTEEAFDDHGCLYSMKPPSPPSWALGQCLWPLALSTRPRCPCPATVLSSLHECLRQAPLGVLGY